MIEQQVRRRVLRWFSRHGLLDPDDVRDMLTWANSGFSLDASVCIAGHDRAGLERLLRYCARPPFALERIEQVNEDRIVYRLPKQNRDGRRAPPVPGGVQPCSRQGVRPTAAPPPPPPEVSPPAAAAPAAPSNRSPAHYLWAMLLARLFASLPLVCPNGGADRRIVAFITETAPVRRILNHIGEPAEPPRIAPALGPPAWDDPPVDPGPDWEALAQPSPEYVFNQEVQW